MEKMIKFFKEYGFWVAAGVVFIALIAVWFLSTSSIAQETEEFKGQVKSKETDVTTVINRVPHPNDNVLTGIDDEIDTMRQRVYRVWKDLYEKQRDDVLFWPEALGDDFISEIKLRSFGDTITRPNREIYQNFIKERFVQLHEIIKAQHPSVDLDTDERSSSRSRARETELPEAPKFGPVVYWHDQNEIEDALVWEEVPSSMKVWYTQEDLWVYETLLNIVAAVNAGAQRHDLARIAEINDLAGGQQGAPEAASGRLTTIASTDPDDADGRGGFNPYGGGAPAEDRGRGGSDLSGADAADLALREGRYMDATGRPLGATEESTEPEFKRLPIRLDLVMDQRYITSLLVECANATLPVEVEQVRVNPGGGFLDQDADDRGRRGDRRDRQRDRDQDEVLETERQHDVNVIVQGVIYIYNPPDVEKLGVSPDEMSSPPASTTPPASGPPATTPPTSADAGSPAAAG